MDRAAFYRALRARGSGLFGTKLSEAQVRGMEGILDAAALIGDGYRDTVAYVLATAYHETGARMVPVREGFATSDAGARRAVSNLAKKRGPKSAVARYSQPAGPYGHVYYGRGLPQLTWLENYEAASSAAGVDLVKDPDRMLDPVISARVLFWGIQTGRWNGRGRGIRWYAEQDGNPDMDWDDLVEARRTVNVQDKAETIAGYARSFERALEAAGMPERIPAALGRLVSPADQVKATVAAAEGRAAALAPSEAKPAAGPRFDVGWFLRLIAAALGLAISRKGDTK